MAKNTEAYEKHDRAAKLVWVHYKRFRAVLNTLREYEHRDSEVTLKVRIAVLEYEEERRKAADELRELLDQMQTEIDSIVSKTLERNNDGSDYPE